MIRINTKVLESPIHPSIGLAIDRTCFKYCYAQQYICSSNFVRPSVTLVLCVKTAEHKILSPSDRPIILVFRYQGLLRKSDGFTPNGSAEYKRDSNFRPKCDYISKTVTDRGIFTMEDEYKVVCAVSNSATL